MDVEMGLRPRNSFSGSIFFKFSVLYLCSVTFLPAAAKVIVELAEISWQELTTPAQGWRRTRERAAQPERRPSDLYARTQQARVEIVFAKQTKNGLETFISFNFFKLNFCIHRILFVYIYFFVFCAIFLPPS
jgi:hypothetical protein